jgi:hypothetical protein
VKKLRAAPCIDVCLSLFHRRAVPARDIPMSPPAVTRLRRHIAPKGRSAL